jgi:hypothetical protein
MGTATGKGTGDFLAKDANLLYIAEKVLVYSSVAGRKVPPVVAYSFTPEASLIFLPSTSSSLPSHPSHVPGHRRHPL